MDTPLKASAAAGKPAAKYGLVLLGLAVGLVAGYGAGRVSTGTPINPLTSQPKGTYEQGYDAARKKLADSGVFPPAPTSATSLSAVVKSVGADSLIVTVDLRSPNPLETTVGPAERTVLVNADTVIVRQVQKTAEQMQKDQIKFQEALRAGKTDVPPPSPSSTEQISLSDLKPGDRIVVTADHDILNEASFTATVVTYLGSGLTAEPPPPMPQAPNAP